MIKKLTFAKILCIITIYSVTSQGTSDISFDPGYGITGSSTAWIKLNSGGNTFNINSASSSSNILDFRSANTIQSRINNVGNLVFLKGNGHGIGLKWSSGSTTKWKFMTRGNSHLELTGASNRILFSFHKDGLMSIYDEVEMANGSLLKFMSPDFGNGKGGLEWGWVYDNSSDPPTYHTLHQILGNDGLKFKSTQQIRFESLSGTNYLLVGDKVGIGVTSPSEKLEVNGTIRSKEIKVEAGPWPDYVFEKDYNLRSLEETEAYIKENKHLPEIPSAEEVEADGVKLGEMNRLLLQKIEELTLYLIQSNEEKKELSQQLMVNTKSQEKKIEELTLDMIEQNERQNQKIKNLQSELKALKNE